MGRFDHEPINRHEALAPLSRDHYTGLVQARRLKRAANADTAERRLAADAFMEAWSSEISVHFADEERLLTEFMEEPDRQRLLREHNRLRELAEMVHAARSQVEPDGEVLQEAGVLLEQHIRWEERELFNRIQDQFGEQALVALEQETARLEQSRPRNISRESPMDQDGGSDQETKP